MGAVRRAQNLSGLDGAADVIDALRELSQIRDDLYNIAVLQNPALFAPGDGGRIARPFNFAPTALPALPATQSIYKNTTDKPILIYLRAIASDLTEFALLLGPSAGKVTLAQAPGLVFARSASLGVVVQPNTEVVATASCATGTVLLTATPIALRGASTALDTVGPCLTADEINEEGAGEEDPEDA